MDGIIAPNGEEQDAYILGVDVPVQAFTGRVIAIIRRSDDVEEKWVVAPDGVHSSKKKSWKQFAFRSSIFGRKRRKYRRSKMRKLIILRGNSGSGKSSVAKKLQREIGRNTLIIPQDVVRRDLLWAHDGYDTAALPLLIQLLQYGYENSEVTILEGILNSKWYKPLFEKAAELYGDNIFAYYYDLPFEKTLHEEVSLDAAVELILADVQGKR